MPEAATRDEKRLLKAGQERARISLGALEKYVLTHTLRAFHRHAVSVLAMDGDPDPTEIASSAQQKAPELRQAASVAVCRLGNRFLFDFGKTFRKRNYLLCVHESCFNL